MTIIIGSARIDEKGKISGGTAGDQKQASRNNTSSNDMIGEVSMQQFYTHKKGWYILRPKDRRIAEKLGENMKTACNNANIGYNQNKRLGVITHGVASKIKTECDCSSLVRECIREASGRDPGNFTTANEASVLEASGLFEKRKAYTPGTALYTGDVLVTKTKGHTVIVTDGAARNTDSATSASLPSDSAPSNSAASGIRTAQVWLNTYYHAGLAADGVYGPKTKAAFVKAWQTEAGGLTVDGLWGTKTKSAASSHNIKKGNTGPLVAVWQAYLVCRGYHPNGIDGKFGPGCHAATVLFQKTNGLTPDGQVGKSTWTKAFE